MRFKLVKILATHEAKYCKWNRMIYIACQIANPDGEAHPKPLKSLYNSIRGHDNTVYVPLASLLHQRATKRKLIKELFHCRTQKQMSKNILGYFDMHRRNILAQSGVPEELKEEDFNLPRIVMEQADLATSRFSHAKTPSWKAWDAPFEPKPLSTTD